MVLIAGGCAGRLQPVEMPMEMTPSPSHSAKWEHLSEIHPGDWFHVLNQGDDALDWRLRAIDSAVESIDLQTFIWELDGAGSMVRDHLLAAAERGAKEQELAQEKAVVVIKEAKEQARTIIAQAEKRNAEIVDAAKDEAKEEADRILVAAKAEVEQEINRAKEELRGKVIDLALAGASKILEREVKIEDHNASLEKLSANL